MIDGDSLSDLILSYKKEDKNSTDKNAAFNEEI
jgi:hypothetical protein